MLNRRCYWWWCPSVVSCLWTIKDQNVVFSAATYFLYFFSWWHANWPRISCRIAKGYWFNREYFNVPETRFLGPLENVPGKRRYFVACEMRKGRQVSTKHNVLWWCDWNILWYPNVILSHVISHPNSKDEDQNQNQDDDFMDTSTQYFSSFKLLLFFFIPPTDSEIEWVDARRAKSEEERHICTLTGIPTGITHTEVIWDKTGRIEFAPLEESTWH